MPSIILYAGEASPSDIVVRPFVDDIRDSASVSTDIILYVESTNTRNEVSDVSDVVLYASEANPRDIVLRAAPLTSSVAVSRNVVVTLRLFGEIESQGGGSTSISVANAAHSHTASSPSLTQLHQISVASASHLHSATSPVVTTQDEIVPSTSLHAHSATSPAVTQSHQISVGNAAHALSSTSPAISQVHILLGSNAFHAHSCTSPSVTDPGAGSSNQHYYRLLTGAG